MKLLIVTQVMDTNEPALGFMVGWVRELATRFESIQVICLKEGNHSLPENVTVHSLGKEEGVGKFVYVQRFFTNIWQLRKEYDSVLVHMNQEYILLAGVFWKMFGKKVYMWRNHYAGSWLTDVAAVFCTKVFCTSKHSYTAKYKRTVLMPVGIDFAKFAIDSYQHAPHTILFLSRIAQSKRPEMLIDALGVVLERGVSFTASIYGSPLPEDQSYYESLQARAESLGLHDRVRFYPGVPNDATPAIYQAHDIFVNCSPSGMFDKTLFEAAASGCRIVASSDDFHDAAGDQVYAPNMEVLAERLIENLLENEEDATRRRIFFISVARAESLSTLADRLSAELQTKQV